MIKLLSYWIEVKQYLEYITVEGDIGEIGEKFGAYCRQRVRIRY